ncbi:response regulator [Natronorubrum sp. JWXQ-INN-674]|uniref:histidine kinase n=1 Tax=Natronorubrum halalkaliphilum TaxID=2691917 RepID=A0A6B0VN82_9EURY|nr:ATP-binding protein [Natronorubrum halalkaliphilum]MXV62928.1 response regulator [Natronorubrum halalkaliphilum]
MAAQIRVLIVADEFDALDLTESIGSDDQFEASTTSTARDALDRLAEDRIDCLVSAYRLPEGDGLELLSTVREQYPDLPFLLVTDDGSEAVASEAISLGVTDYLRATEGSALASRITDAVSEHRAREQRRDDSNLLDELFDQIPIHLFVKDTAGRHARVSTHLIDEIEHDTNRLTVDAFTRSEIIGNTDVDIADGVHEREAYADDMRVIETGEPIRNKEEYSPLADEWNLTSKVPWYDEDGDIQGLIGVSHRITERKRYQQELERQNERLDEFTRLVSHDLRNPLNVAQGHLELARADSENEALDIVAESHDRMEALVENLLTIAREGEAVTELESVPIAELVQRCWQTVATGTAGLAVETDAVVRADRQRLAQLVENLLCNAVEHGASAARSSNAENAVPNGGTDVTITVGILDTDNGFYVADDGNGIPAAERERVLKRGYSTNADGTGFGLSIVAQIASAHGWTVSVTESDDGGARFEFTDVEFVDDRGGTALPN